MEDYFKLYKSRKSICDEYGDKTGYRLFTLRIPDTYPKILNAIVISKNDENYKYAAIPILNEPQKYYIKPVHVCGNINFVKEINILEMCADSDNGEDAENFIFYKIGGVGNDKFEHESKIDILDYLGLAQLGKSLVLTKRVSESGITKLSPMFENNKMAINNELKREIEKIKHNSWILSVIYSINDSLVDENNRKYLSVYGIRGGYKSTIDKLVELGYIFKNDGKIYDVYTLFDLFDYSYTGFIYDVFSFGETLDRDKMYDLFEKYSIDFEEKKKDFLKLYSNIVGYFISTKFDDLLDSQDENKIRILKFLGLYYRI